MPRNASCVRRHDLLVLPEGVVQKKYTNFDIYQDDAAISNMTVFEANIPFAYFIHEQDIP